MSARLIAALVLLVALNASASAETLRLVLAPVRTSVKPGSPVLFDLYVINLTSFSQKVPSLERWSALFVIEHKASPTVDTVGGLSDLTGDPIPYHSLAPKSFEHRRIKAHLNGHDGDIAFVCVVLTGEPKPESNQVTIRFLRASRTSRSARRSSMQDRQSAANSRAAAR